MENVNAERSRSLDSQYQIILFFILTLLIGWYPWYTGGSGVFFWGPFIAALIVVGAVQRKAGILSLLRRLAIWKTNVSWYVVVVVSPIVVAVVAIVLHVVFGGTAPEFPLFKDDQWMILVAAFMFLFPLTASAFQEEVGFRGFALPLIQKRWGPLVGTVILGTFFGAWLLPEFLVENSAQYMMGGLSFYPWFILTEISWSIIMTWVFNNTKGSALISGWLFHGFFNLWTLVLLTNAVLGADFPAFDTGLLIMNALVLTLAAVGLILVTKGQLDYDKYMKIAESE